MPQLHFKGWWTWCYIKGLLWSNCLVYIDDIIIVGRTFEQHLNSLAQVFDCLEQAGLKLQPHKCHLLQSKLQLLGHIISPDGVSPDPEKTNKTKEWSGPTSVKDVQQFLRLANYYQVYQGVCIHCCTHPQIDRKADRVLSELTVSRSFWIPQELLGDSPYFGITWLVKTYCASLSQMHGT